jgi:hypothetical protein
VPPAARATWQSAAAGVRIAWTTSGLPSGLEIAVQRIDPLRETWAPVTGFGPATAGYVDDVAVESGHSYRYRLRARDARGRVSEDEPLLGPVAVP